MGKEQTPLAPYRVLDLVGEIGDFCPKVLAALGADVIKIEPPGGHPTRRIGPFYHDEPDLEKSLHWFHYNLNKRSITLNIECATGQDFFKRLVKTADFLVESFRPGYLDKLGLGYSQLRALNPRLIHISITPFGSTGPYSQFKGSNLVASAMSGFLLLCGDPDRPPVQVTVPVSYVETGLQAVAAGMVAFWYQQRTGEGQHVDVSAQEVLTDQILPYSLVWKNMVALPYRDKAGAHVPGRTVGPAIMKCKDEKYVVCFSTIDRGRQPLREWLASEGMAGNLLDKEWDPVILQGAQPTEGQKNHLDKLFQAFASKYTSDELMWEAQKRDIQVAKVFSVRDVVENPHSKHSGYFVRVEHPELGQSILYPGSPIKSDGISWSYERRAPFIGEHNEEIYGKELGLSREEMAVLKQGGVI
ncbi:MAG: putative acyl-CoA transferase/carnitine dehydratase [Dehalococcoidales bacterium]|nr:putative acyl-CoA transferase/carnitine dehydratase [Dehalococcoidales bacterium]